MDALTTLLWAANISRYAIEALAFIYAAAFFAAAVRYIRIWNRNSDGASESRDTLDPATSKKRGRTRVAIIYLCCGDLDSEALLSLSKIRSDGCSSLIHILHDDSTDASEQQRVDAAVSKISRKTGVTWNVLRREIKTGGKPGALNAVLETTADGYDYFVLCDNDSYAFDDEIITKTLGSFDDPDIAVVQFRNRTKLRKGDSGFNQCLAYAIEIFDIFMTGLYRGLWTPFVGHNAMLKTRDVINAGGATPGFFADDIDLTVRLNYLGKKVLYRRNLSMSETHPSNFSSFCLRSEKWSRGCGQIIRKHFVRVLVARSMTIQQKTGFLLFCGFYATQSFLLVYLILVFLVLPVLSPSDWEASLWFLAFSFFIPLSIFAVISTYLGTEGKKLPAVKILFACVFTYGAMDLWTTKGLVKGLIFRSGKWIPTNSIDHGMPEASNWVHFLLGVSCLIIPAILQPILLLSPMTWLFTAKFMFVPAVGHLYQPAKGNRPVVIFRRLANRFTTLILFAVAISGTLAILVGVHSAQESRVRVHNGKLLVEGDEILIKGIHYSPWREGTGPGKGFDYPDRELVSFDLDLIKDTGANSVVVYDAPGWVAEVASERELNVIYVFYIPWFKIADGMTEDVGRDVRSKTELVRNQQAIIAWMIGNEAPGWVIDKIGVSGFRNSLSDLRDAVRAADDTRPVAYGNWPITADLDLDRDMDILTYNLYPFYPTEVAAEGYGNYIRNRLMPLTRGRPLIISEFGINTLEVSPERQAQILKECWTGILESGAQGGVVFGFADEWWKNYDNPVQAPDWWRRQDSPDDHLTHDKDPEEHYGIFHHDRKPKPAVDAVREMFTNDSAGFAVTFPGLTLDVLKWGAVAFLVLLALGFYLMVLLKRRGKTKIDVKRRIQ
ncbi:MAG TPA: glycoside hydrolase family 2 TIM barrel-domain containing protein [Aridibacter sp.]|nr:glycoside hydrolase family 2 TIM barrel-domain containing protein [Aridibacter sp.]